MVDSGYRIAHGSSTGYDTFKDMVDAALARPPGARITARSQRVGDRVRVVVEVTNDSGGFLNGASNGATVHVLVYEEAKVLWTNRYVRGGVSRGIEPALAPEATRSFTLETADLPAEVNWDNVRCVAFVDYRPGGQTGPYDMLQAAHAPFEVPEPVGWAYLPFVKR